MNKWLALLVAAAMLPACNGAAPPAVESASTEVSALAALPATLTPTPTATAVVIPPTATPAVAVIEPMATATALPTATLPLPTDTPTPAPTATPTPVPDWLNTVGRTEAGLVFMGNPNAPVTFIDYSDFM